MTHNNRHPKIQERIQEINTDADTRTHELKVLDYWTSIFDLHRLLDLSRWFHVTTDTMSIRDDEGQLHHVKVERYHTLIRVAAQHKAELRPILLAAFDSFDKSFLVDNYSYPRPPQLCEIWSHKWDVIDNPIGANAYNNISVYFESNALEGQHLSDTCTVSRITHEPVAETRLTITCQKSES